MTVVIIVIRKFLLLMVQWQGFWNGFWDGRKPLFDLNLPVWVSFTNSMKAIALTKEEKFLITITENVTLRLLFHASIWWVSWKDCMIHKAKHRTSIFSSPKLTPKSRIGQWKDFPVSEFKIFLRLLLHNCTVKLPRLNDYCKTHGFSF